jgi:TRAP-type C4-dicarboxylate transport system permease small subunit
MDAAFRFVPEDGPSALRPLAWARAGFDVAAAWLICALLAVMVTAVSLQVAMRYGLNRSFDSADELSRLTFVWTIFLALPLGLKSGAHIGVEMLVARLPKAAAAVLARLMALGGAALLLLVAWESARLAWEQWDELMGAVDASAAWFIVPLAWCGVHGALHLLWAALTGRHGAPQLLEDLG